MARRWFTPNTLARAMSPAQPVDVTRHRHGRPSDLRGQLRLILIAWLFGSYWLWTISGAAMTQFARSLGTPDYGFGLLATLPFLGTLMQLPATWFQSRFGHRKQIFLITAVVGRFMWVVAAMIPWILPGARAWWWLAMIGSLLISWLLMQASGPSWMNWMSDVIPKRIRGRFFARRNLLGQPIGVLLALAIGYILDLVMAVEGERPDIMLKATSAVIAVGGLMGVLDILCFRGVHDPKADAPPKPIRLHVILREPLRHREFRLFLGYTFTLTLALGFIGQYLWLYLFDVLHWSNGKANLLLVCVPLLALMIGYRVWGRVIDHLGKKPVILITGAIVTVGALGWLVITPERLWPGYALILIVTMAWPGMELANFNFILDLAGSSSKDNPQAGTAYVTINAIVVAIAGVLSGLLAALIAELLQDLSVALPVFGIVLTYHGVLFLISTALRGLSLLWVIGLHEPEAAPTRDAIRYMTASLYSNVRQALFMPTRVVGRVRRWTYRINGEG